MHVIPVILAGGIGERFWPMSRSSFPKQLHAIGSGKTMLEETLLRVNSLCDGDAKPMLITGAGIANKVTEMLGGNIAAQIEIIAEPAGKNTAPAIALAAAVFKRRYGDAIMAVVSADHAISPADKFMNAVQRAINIAVERDELVVFGIKPTRPETGYGYIELGKSLIKVEPAGTGAYEIQKFVEKPSIEKAEMFVESGNFLWNSGMFVWKASTILEEFERHMPDLYKQVMDAAEKDFSAEAVNEFYAVCRAESIDFGIMEKTKRVSAVCGDFFWDDLGSWEALSRIHENNKSGTTVTGPLVYEKDCANSIVVNKSAHTVAAIGLHNVAVIAVDDAILVIDRSRLPNLKKYLGEIKNSGKFPGELF